MRERIKNVLRLTTQREDSMALRTGTRLEVGQRVSWLRKQAGLTHREAAELIGINDSGLFGRIEKHGKSFDYERIGEIADAFAGRGTLVDDSRELFDFMVFHGEVGRVLRPHLRLVEADGQPLKSADDDTAKGGYPSALAA
jgi:transcriptional regulator with XRE-family HTH domain